MLASQNWRGSLDSRVIILGRRGLLRDKSGGLEGVGSGSFRWWEEVSWDAEDAPQGLLGAGCTVASSTELGEARSDGNRDVDDAIARLVKILS